MLTEDVRNSVDFTSFLGMEIDEAYSVFGAPVEMFSVRGDKAWQDDVVFYYKKSFYLFWYKNRIWQVRADSRYTGKVNGIAIGDLKESVMETLGESYFEDERSIFFILQDKGYPVRARIFLTEGSVSDIYIYRADF